MLASGQPKVAVLRQQRSGSAPRAIAAGARLPRTLLVRAAAQSAPVGGVRARWCLDVRYGRKQEATALLQEWVAKIGSKVGLNASNTAISSGAIGVPESRLEMEVTLGSMAEWEAFLGAVPGQEHLAWSQRLQGMVVDGSPRWEVLRVCAVMQEPASSSSTATTTSYANSATGIPGSKLVFADKVMPEDEALWQAMQRASDSLGEQPTAAPLLPPDEPALPEQAPLLDWKGDPMQINPGDKLPFKFL